MIQVVKGFFPAFTAGMVALLLAPGCAPRNPHQTQGFLVPFALQRACISGKVTDAVTGQGLDGVALKTDPPVGGVPIVTNRDGFFYAELGQGTYRISFAKAGYRSSEETLSLNPGEVAGRDVALEPLAPVIVDAGGTVTRAAPGSTVELSASVTLRDGSRLQGIHWSLLSREGGVTARVAETDGRTIRVTLPGEAEYRRALLYGLRRDGRLLDRWMSLGLSPSDLKEAGQVTLTAIATTDSGTYTDSVDIIADLHAFATVNPGLANVAIGEPVFLQGKTQAAYAWSLVAPAGSAAALRYADTANPSFTPDVEGTYLVREGNAERIVIRSGSWNGALATSEAVNQRQWVGANGCLCHYRDQHFFDWKDSGHAEIFNQCADTIFHYEEHCFTCHTVGFGGQAPSNGISTLPEYADYLQDPGYWDHDKDPPVGLPRPGSHNSLLLDYPEVAQRTNVQCENCHGPNNSPAHKTLKKTGAPERISVSSQVCGTCHDKMIEPSSPQWLASGHGNYSLAIRTSAVEHRGSSAGDCGRCHSGQGFLAWVARGDRFASLADSGSGSETAGLAALGLADGTVQPVTCATCHDPHNPGSTFRSQTEKVPMRKVDAARMHPREFSGNAAGRSSLCIACHSSMTGAYNDVAYPRIKVDTAPHISQADVMFGENAYFVATGKQKSHALIEDNCIWCHAKPVPKPSAQGYPRGGASHSFRTERGLCARCHAEMADGVLMDAMEGDIGRLKQEIEQALAREIGGPGSAPLRLIESEEAMAVEMLNHEGSNRVRFQDITLGGIPLLATDRGQVLAKAAWNYFLLQNDHSKGAHNPQFVAEVVAATLEELSKLAG
jgi:hypothetical protein